MTPQFARGLLRVVTPVYLGIYQFVLFVATVTSGDELIRQPGAWYAAIAPLLYVLVVGVYAFGSAKAPMPGAAAIALHAVVIPALVFSFLGLGVLLPVVAALWWFMTREQPRGSLIAGQTS